MTFLGFCLEAESFLRGVMFVGDCEALVIPVFPKGQDNGRGPFDDAGCPGVGIQMHCLFGRRVERKPFGVAQTPCYGEATAKKLMPSNGVLFVDGSINSALEGMVRGCAVVECGFPVIKPCTAAC